MTRIPKIKDQNVLDIKFNKSNTIVALIYQTILQLFDISQQSSLQNTPTQTSYTIANEYIKILAIEFKDEKLKIGRIAIQANKKQNDGHSVHIYNFSEKQINILTKKQIDLNTKDKNIDICVKFLSQLDQIIIIAKPLGSINDCLPQTCESFIYDIQELTRIEIPKNKEIQYLALMQDFGDQVFRPFCTLNSDNYDFRCLLILDDNKKISIDQQFDKDNTKVLTMYAKFDKAKEQIIIKIAFLKDQEKLQIYSYKEEYSGFDQLQSILQQKSQSEEHNEEHCNNDFKISEDAVLEYREFQEYKISNFQYPYFAYIDLSRSIVVQFLDQSQKTLRIICPEQNKWYTITQIKITIDGFVNILVENILEIYLYQYDLNTQQFTNQSNPLIKILKSSIGGSIQDFWIHIQFQDKHNFKKEQKYELSFYYLTYLSKELSVIYNSNGKNQDIETIGTNIGNIIVREQEGILLYTLQGKIIYSLMFQGLKYKQKLVYKELDGQILQLIDTSNNQNVWIILWQETAQQLYLKQISFQNQMKGAIGMNYVLVQDISFIKYIMKSYQSCFIEESQQNKTILYVTNNQIFSIDSLIQDQTLTSPVQFHNIINLNDDEEIMSNSPLVNKRTFKTLFLIKNNKQNSKQGIIFPSLLSENKQKLISQTDETSKQEFITIINPDQDQHDQNLFLKINFENNFYQVLNIKQQILAQQSFQNQILEKGKFQVISQNLQYFLTIKQETQSIYLFKIILNQENLSLTVSYIREIKCPVVQDQAQPSKFFGKHLKLMKNEQEKSFGTLYHVNNNGDILIQPYIKEQKIYEFYLFQKFEHAVDWREVCVQLEFKYDQQTVKIPKGVVISESNVIVFSDYICLLYNIQSKTYQTLSLQLANYSNNPYQHFAFLEVMQASNNQNLFVCRIQNSLSSHMVILWDQKENQEVTQTDCCALSVTLLDEEQNVYILDNKNGLSEITLESGSFSHQAFKNALIMTRQQIIQDQSTQIHYHKQHPKGQKIKRFILKTKTDDCEDENKWTHKFHNHNQEQKIEKQYLKYAITKNNIVLPYSYFQLIIMKNLNKLKANQNNYLENYAKIVSGLQMDQFCYELQNSTIFHKSSQNYQELFLFLDTFQKKDPFLLNMLLVQDQNFKIPLEIAVEKGNPRCINLIMTMMAKGCQSSFGKSIYLLKQIFPELIDYTAFSLLIESTFYQSNQYQQVLQLASPYSEDLNNGGIIKSHNTVSIDKKFQEIFIDSSSTGKEERNVDVKAIRADWIFEPEGYEFLKTLSKNDNMELFQLESVQIIILFLWKEYKKKILYYLFYPFLAYMILFTLQFTLLPPFYQQLQTDPNAEDFGNDSMQNFLKVLLILPSYLVLPALIYFMGYEILQLKRQKLDYFFDPWNILDFTSLTTNMIVTVLSLYEAQDDPLIRIIAACTIIILYLKFFYFLRIFESTSAMIRTIVQISYDIRFFLFILGIAIMGFGNGIFIIYQSQSDPSLNTLTTFSNSIFSVYNMALGNGDSSFDNMNGEYVLYALYILSSFLITIMLLNMLIAIMGDTFGNVKEIEEQAKMREYLQLIMDNIFLVSKSDFKNIKYIVNIQIDKEKKTGEGSLDQINSQGSIEHLTSYIDKKFETFTRKQEFMMKYLIKMKNESKLFTKNLIQKGKEPVSIDQLKRPTQRISPKSYQNK